ncbi:hypothetical protein M885DRAFT_615164 [Pelagophyceae sp. CCMP2097]|nr:hypothetical protein M885DRAFT_615164 [Pelagophyceae sp. CCMP2097]|mmetsp:Transcript_2848/g.8425  ORF Transcript_2848/g.8425 Transcript_2848/m.8425 type:complete len:303 (-) Transcript_2848:39-947(-)|eukprot:CAMPEP_0184261856 /NCGR_PEP_ID=MMETSP0977-20130417/15583_1 /TAXON_ID=483370 /ORGANISM="non described non described, Strain CCMP2097" /LENGTH=302 /DNA_ID=CAMNT_0026567533 /DNA_START=65 /DNA_END=973 /DNA_ORIENTATION=+
MAQGARKLLRVGGVPEHFNWPWHRALRSGAFGRQGLDVEWRTYPGGSGAMSAALKSGEIDVACMLTEAALAECHKGAPYKVFGFYVKSPLVWGIHAAANSTNCDDWAKCDDPVVGVSRYGSGSHLMALVDARVRGKPAPQRWAVVESLPGARTALAAGSADAFFWEKFTTKPVCDAGEWKKVDECPTPWPCFALAVADAALAANGGPEALLAALDVVRGEAERLKAAPAAAVAEIAAEYDLKPADVAEWFATVEWSCLPHAPKETLRFVAEALLDANILEKHHLEVPYDQLVAKGHTKDQPI